MGDFMMVVLTALLAFFAFLTWRTYDRIEFLTGAMDSHGTMDIRLQVMKWNIEHPEHKIKLVWWDKTIEALPPYSHGDLAEVTQVHVMLPLGRRQGQNSLCRDLRLGCRRWCDYVTGKCRWPRE